MRELPDWVASLDPDTFTYWFPCQPDEYVSINEIYVLVYRPGTELSNRYASIVSDAIYSRLAGDNPDHNSWVFRRKTDSDKQIVKKSKTPRSKPLPLP